MSWKKIFINYKPSIGCLTTHQSEWSDLPAESQREAKICNYCKNYFYYPTKSTDKPIYRKS